MNSGFATCRFIQFAVETAEECHAEEKGDEMVILGALFDSMTAFTSECEASLEKVTKTLKQSMDEVNSVSQELLSFYEDDFPRCEYPIAFTIVYS